MTTAVIGNQIVKVKENTETFGKLPASINKWAGEAGGAYDMMNTFKKVAVLANHHSASGLGMYVAGAALPRLITSSHTFYKDIKTAQEQPMTSYLAARLTYGIFEVSAMISFVTSLFIKNFMPFVNTGIVLKGASDTVEVGLFGADVVETNAMLKKAKEAGVSDEVRSGLEAKANYSLIKLTKAVTGSISGFFSSWTIFKGTHLVSPTLNVSVSLVSSLANVAAYHQKNYVSKYFAEIETPKVLKFA